MDPSSPQTNQNVRLIALRSAGCNNTDLAHIVESKYADLSVVHVPAYSPNAVAEHALAMLMTLNRRTHKVKRNETKRARRGDDLVGVSTFHSTGPPLSACASTHHRCTTACATATSASKGSRLAWTSTARRWASSARAGSGRPSSASPSVSRPACRWMDTRTHAQALADRDHSTTHHIPACPRPRLQGAGVRHPPEPAAAEARAADARRLERGRRRGRRRWGQLQVLQSRRNLACA